MRVVQKTINLSGNTRKMYYEQFNSYDEYWRIVEQRERTNSHDESRNVLTKKFEKNWYGVSTYKEAKELLVNGWGQKVSKIQNALKKEIELCDTKRVARAFSNVCGFMPIVPNAIIGLPNCMIDTRKDLKKTRVIKIMIEIGCCCQYDSDEIIDYFSKVLARIYALEKSGYRCRIEVLSTFSSPEKEYTETVVGHSILIKSENQLFDTKRMAFPIAHSAMLRVFGFGWENSLPIDYNSYHTYGLGRAYERWPRNARKEFEEQLNENGEKIIVLTMGDDLDEIFGKGVINNG